MSDIDEARSAETRARAERALVLLVHEIGDEEVPLIVLGGLVPEVLTRDEDAVIPQHLGTTDVDVLLITHLDADSNLGTVERALKRLEFKPDGEAWRWRGRIDGRPVKIEFLCDLEDRPEGEVVSPTGCTELAAVNLRGTGYVAVDWAWEQLSAMAPDGSEASVRVHVRFAGLEGYLLSKCVAVRTRGLEKDYYDFAFVLLHSRAGGPEPAAAQLREGNLSDALPGLRSTFLEVRERYVRHNDVGPVSYAEQSLQVDPELDPATLRADAVDVVARFFRALEL
jgi:hypothetical protein